MENTRERFNLLGFSFSRSPVSLAIFWSRFFFPEAQIQQEAFTLEEVRGDGCK